MSTQTIVIATRAPPSAPSTLQVIQSAEEIEAIVPDTWAMAPDYLLQENGIDTALDTLKIRFSRPEKLLSKVKIMFLQPDTLEGYRSLHTFIAKLQEMFSVHLKHGFYIVQAKSSGRVRREKERLTSSRDRGPIRNIEK